MGKGIRKKIAVFLTLCMVCSLFTGVPVYAEENQADEGGAYRQRRMWA